MLRANRGLDFRDARRKRIRNYRWRHVNRSSAQLEGSVEVCPLVEDVLSAAAAVVAAAGH